MVIVEEGPWHSAAQCTYVQMQGIALGSETCGGPPERARCIPVMSIEGIIWKENGQGCKKRGRSDLCNLKCVMLAQ